MGVKNAITSIGDYVANGFSNVMSKIQTGFTDVLKYLNPLSEQFFLKLAFIPSEGFVESKVNDLRLNVSSHFSFVDQIRDTVNSVVNGSYNAETWLGIKYSNPMIGEVVIVSPIAVNEWGYKIRYWIAGFLYFLTLVCTVKRLAEVLGS